MFVRFIASLLIRLYVRQAQNTSNRGWVTRIFFVDVYVFDLRQSEIYTSSLLKMRLIRDRVIVMKYSYEYKEDSILIVDNRIDWFFRLDVLETIYCEKILHCRMPRSDLINIFILVLLHSGQFHEIDWFKSISRDFRSENVCDCSCSRIILVRSRRQWFELTVVQDHSIMIRDLKWNCFEFSENITSNWFFYCN